MVGVTITGCALIYTREGACDSEYNGLWQVGAVKRLGIIKYTNWQLPNAMAASI